MNRNRDKRAAFVLALLLVIVFVLGQARRADADRHADIQPTIDGGLIADGNAGGACSLHD